MPVGPSDDHDDAVAHFFVVCGDGMSWFRGGPSSYCPTVDVEGILMDDGEKLGPVSTCVYR